ncbi:MAG: multicopper oxidase domain-containing protein [Gammaproteobacteria bacterium]|nr:multicopper oxidase domain-containing protein [Gammaproteobacteria bacterium]
MKKLNHRPQSIVVIFTAVLLLCSPVGLQAAINGISGTTFNLTARPDYISTADGGSMLLWGYANGASRAQYPGPTLIIDQNETITITLRNGLLVAGGTTPNVSLVIPGQEVTASCTGTCPQGELTLEAPPGGLDEVSYTFTAAQPGTYTYHSGTNPGLQVEMGLTGAIIVRPAGFQASSPTAYGHPDTAYTYEELFFLTEMDPNIHQAVEFYGPDHPTIQPMLDNYFSNYWFINGRTAPDDLAAANVLWLPTQPYNSVPRMHPGDTVLMRVVGGGREMHPFHHHGNHAKVIARDGRMLASAPGAGPDIATEGFTITSTPGKTVDALFTWTGEGLNWDIYGGSEVWTTQPELAHTCNGLTTPSPGFDPVTQEYCPDHGKPFPVVLPGNLELAFGGWWGGSPYLGSLGTLPPGEGGLNPNGGFSFMWHSHTEKELTNWDIFPGGMLTMMIIEAYNVPIE